MRRSYHLAETLIRLRMEFGALVAVVGRPKRGPPLRTRIQPIVLIAMIALIAAKNQS